MPRGYDPENLVAIETVVAVTGAGGKVAVFGRHAEVRVFR
jgi:hypothetical protein